MEFKDKIYNGKTVSEIFAQRGENVKPSEMIREEVYLLEKNKYQSDIIHKHEDVYQDILFAAVQLFDTGSIFRYGYVPISKMGSIYKATPDQIELLNFIHKSAL